ncbi:MAG: hypothetical protein ACE5JQ_14265 [Candidatus Methylomirabilales bacterium]
MSQFKNKRLMVIVGLTLVAFAVLIYDNLLSGKSPRRHAVSSARRVTSSQTALPVAVPTTIPGRRLAAPPPPDQPWQQDPFAIQGKWVSNATFTNLKVSGIVWGPDGYKALVNDFVVRVGDEVKGIRILQITAEGVKIEKDGRTGFVYLLRPEITP